VRFRFYYRERGSHTHVRLFGAKDDGAFALVGVLIYRNDEWLAFRLDTQETRFEFLPEETAEG
jgi:hypothetical protein